MVNKLEHVSALVNEVLPSIEPNSSNQRQAGDALRKALNRAEKKKEIELVRDTKRLKIDRSEFLGWLYRKYPKIVGKFGSGKPLVKYGTGTARVSVSASPLHATNVPQNYDDCRAAYLDLDIKCAGMMVEIAQLRKDLATVRKERDQIRDELAARKAKRRAASSKRGKWK